MMHANSKKFAYFCLKDFKPKLFLRIKIIALKTILLHS